MKRLQLTTDSTIYKLEDYNQFMMDMYEDFTPLESKNEAFYEWASDCIRQDVEDFFDNVKYSQYNTPCYITGTLGLWDGRHTIERVDCNTLEDAIYKCYGKSDNVEIYADGNAVYVNAYHHDGCNEFKIVIKGKKIKGGYLF